MTSKTITSLVSTIRSWASKTKDNKESYAKAVISGAEMLNPRFELFAESMKVRAIAAQKFGEVVTHFLSTEKLREGLETFVEHVVTDAANRANELGNLIESTANHEGIQQSIQDIKDADARLDELREEVLGKKKKADEGEGTSPPRRKKRSVLGKILFFNPRVDELEEVVRGGIEAGDRRFEEWNRQTQADLAKRFEEWAERWSHLAK